MRRRNLDGNRFGSGAGRPLGRTTVLALAACGFTPWLLLGCASTDPAPPQRYSGFLADYSILSPREGSDGAALRYVKPGAALSLQKHHHRAELGRYEQLLIDPVVVYYGVGTGLHDVPAEDLETLANHLYSALVQQLGADYPLVRHPGPGVLRIQAALTEAQPSDVVLNAVSSALPVRPLSGLTQLATGTRAFVGSAGVEAKIVDAASGELLVAAVDRRQGGKRLEDAQGGWSDVLAAFDYWATQLRSTLAEAREQARGAAAP